MLTWRPNNQHEADFGYELKFNKTWLKSSSSYQYDENSMPNVVVTSLTSSAYAQDTWDLDELWTLQPGLRLSWYQSLDINLDQIPDASYVNLDPRFSIRRKLNLAESIYASYGFYHQYLTLLAADISTPFDVWFPWTGA
jgi:outer membrane receptor protein involved in Fe transport